MMCRRTLRAKLVLPTLGRAARIDQLGVLQAGGEVVQVDVAGRDAGHFLVALLLALLEAVVGLVDRLLQRLACRR